jgi:hypothetical protein
MINIIPLLITLGTEVIDGDAGHVVGVAESSL